MKQKTYRADTMKEARLKVKMDLGKDAKILETRRVQEGGFFGFMADTVIEVDAAVTPSSNGSNPSNRRQSTRTETRRGSKPTSDRRNGRPQRSSRAPSGQNSNSNAGKEFERSVDESVEPSFGPRQQAEQLIREHETNGSSSDHTYNRPRSGGSNPETSTRKSQTESPSENGTNGTNGDQDNPVSTEKLTRVLENTDRLTEKIDELASSLDDDSSIRDGGGENFPGKLTPVYQELIDSGVEAEVARDLIGRVRRQLEADELDQIDRIKEKMKNEISSDIPVADPLQVDRDETLLLPFVGSTGVGKTTTMAKLAAHFSVEEGLDVSFITFDTYRLAAVEQLRCYADILQVPVEAVMSEEEFKDTLEEFKTSSDIVFIDTAGRSQFDEDKIKELEGMIESEESVITHLVVDSTSRPEDLDSILRGFEPIGYDRIVVTKLDETRHHGTLLNLGRRVESPISYVTDGQDVPDDLSRLDPDAIASLILGEDVESLNTHSASEDSGARD